MRPTQQLTGYNLPGGLTPGSGNGVTPPPGMAPGGSWQGGAFPGDPPVYTPPPSAAGTTGTAAYTGVNSGNQVGFGNPDLQGAGNSAGNVGGITGLGPSNLGSNGAVGTAGGLYDPTSPAYGQVGGGAALQAQYYQGIANGFGGIQAPTNTTGATQQTYAEGQQALGLTAATAAGGGPAQQAAQATLAQGTGNSLQAMMAMANSSRGGGPALAAAQNQAINSADTIQQGGIAAAQQQAQMAAQAQGAYGTLAGNLGAQAQSAANYQAELQQQQTAQNEQAALAYNGLANSVQEAQLSADTGTYGANKGVAIAGMQTAAQQQASEISGGAALTGTILTGLATVA
jgi:hypothetical protein